MRIPSSASMSVPFSYTVERPHDDLVLYRFTGDVDSPQLTQIAARWATAGTPPDTEIVIDLSSVTFLGVDGMWLLDRFRRRVQRAGNRFTLITDVPRVDGPLRALGFADRFEYRSHWDFIRVTEMKPSRAHDDAARAPTPRALTGA